MMASIHDIAVLLCNVMIGLLSGVYFIFSNTVMTSLAKANNGAAIMGAINEDILNPIFKLMFIISAVLSAYFAVFAPSIELNERVAYAVFFIGTFVVTLVKNIPDNNRLKAQLKSPQELSQVWQDYLKHWVFWNHIRSFSAICSLVLLNM